MIEAWSRPGNASSPHIAGEQAARLVADARASVAALIGAMSAEVIFTSGATEANNLALLGTAVPTALKRKIIVSAIEHKSVLEVAAHLAKLNFEIVLAPVDHHGRLDLVKLEALLDEHTLLVSLMAANNETGVLQPVAEVVALAHARGALVHCDGAQAVGKIAIDVFDLDVDYLSFSSHKMYGPMGIGALYVSSNAPRPVAQSFGGGQQGGLRAGTEPVPLIVGFGEAARIAARDLDASGAHTRSLSLQLLRALSDRQIGYRPITGDHVTVPGSLALQFVGVNAEDLCASASHRVSISTGSACTAGQLRTSHVLESMGLSGQDAACVVRVFCHRYLTEADIAEAADAITEAARRQR
ncbi:cysteine desulfurase [Sphingobium sp. YR768]|nr:cysteine desulfurase [Sphingobium sp. YR768]